MKLLKRTASIFILIASTHFAFAAPAGSTAEKNKKMVTEFYDMVFNQHKPTEAAKKYMGGKYIQHNPNVPNGAEAFYEYFEKFFKDHPKAHSKIYRALADEDLVALHVHSQMDDKDLGNAIVDIFRVENGKIVEHFDVIQAVPVKTANGNTMFEGSNEK